MNAETLLQTPLNLRHRDRKARMVPFAGYEMPVQYLGLLEETKATRSHCGLFDVSHMGQFSVQGKNSLQAVQRLVTNDLSKIKLGQAQYNMLCNENGGVIDDLIVYRRTEEETYICVNASNRIEDLAWMKQHLDDSVCITDESDETALIAIQGPLAQSILAKGVRKEILDSLKYYWATDTTAFGAPTYLSRTGYTGEDGFELYLESKDAVKIWDILLEEGASAGLMPCGLGARDTLRLEMGYPLHGHELSPTISPLQANLGWVVKLKAGNDFIGRDALVKEATEGPKQILRGFIVKDRRIARQGYPIKDLKGNRVGQITSGTHSPHRNAPIALGFIDTKVPEGTALGAEIRNDFVPLEIASLPFVPSHTKR